MKLSLTLIPANLLIALLVPIILAWKKTPWEKKHSVLNATSDIFGGRLAQKDEFPFVVNIYVFDVEWNNGTMCTGSIATPTRIITTCHCLGEMAPGLPPQRIGRRQYTITAGALDFEKTDEESSAQFRFPSQVILHPRCFMWHYIAYDIGLLQLEDSAAFVFNKHIQPMKLPLGTAHEFRDTVTQIVQSQTICEIVGWGIHRRIIDPENPDNFTEQWSSVPRVVQTRLIDDNECEQLVNTEFYRLSIHYDPKSPGCVTRVGYICGILVNESDRENHDSVGGPVICDGKVIGVASYGSFLTFYPPGYLNFFSSLQDMWHWVNPAWSESKENEEYFSRTSFEDRKENLSKGFSSHESHSLLIFVIISLRIIEEI